MVNFSRERLLFFFLCGCGGVLWCVYFGYQCGNLSSSHKIFSTTLETLDNDGRAFPKVLFCPFENVEIDTNQLFCRVCMQRTPSSQGPGGCVEETALDFTFDNTYYCYIWNTEDTPAQDQGGGSIFCNISSLASTDLGRFYLYDHGWQSDYFDVNDKSTVFPEGIIGRTVYPASRTSVVIARDKYIIGNEKTYAYREIDAQTRPIEGSSNAIFELYYGDLIEATYHESRESQYTFSLWIGLIGGFSFLVFAFVQGTHAVVCSLLGWEKDDHELIP